jgi:hypothetical protein
MSKKVILFIVEGKTEMIALGGALSKMYRNDLVRFKVINGDITSNGSVNVKNAIKRVYEEVEAFLQTEHFHKEDLKQIIHLVDTDGVFIPNDRVIEANLDKIFYDKNSIMTRYKVSIEVRNRDKSAVLKKLYHESEIAQIPYKMYFMSCNFDHVLCHEANLADTRKRDVAEEFDYLFHDNPNMFRDFFFESKLAVRGEYFDTWSYISKGVNSLKRHSNFHLLFSYL